MKVADTVLQGVKLMTLDVHRDNRGYFLETFQARRYGAQLPGYQPFVQDNCSYSARNVVRGLHYQLKHPQGKLVRVARGDIIDVTVDVRRDSPQFGRAQMVAMSAHDFTQLWVPPGYAHGFVVVSDDALVEYKCTDFYQPGDEVCLRWDDPVLGIDWPVSEPVVSEKDRQGLSLSVLCELGSVF